MSTGLECQFIEVQPARWFYLLQDWDCPVGAWDWREYATAYGPFTSDEAAQQHLRDNHANPGGYSIQPYSADNKPDTLLEKLTKEAEERQQREAVSAYKSRLNRHAIRW